MGVAGLDLLFCAKADWSSQYFVTIFDEPAFEGEWTDWAKCDDGTFIYGAAAKTAPGPEPIIDDTALEGLKIVCKAPCDADFVYPTDGDFEGAAYSNYHIVGEVTDGRGVWGEYSAHPTYLIGGADGLGVPPLGIFDDRGMTGVAFVLVENCCEAT